LPSRPVGLNCSPRSERLGSAAGAKSPPAAQGPEAPGPDEDLRPPRRYLLPDGLRRELGKPFGPVVGGNDLPAALNGFTTILAVGDVVSLTLKNLGIEPALFVCDFLTQRGEPDPTYELELGTWGELAFRVRNPAGAITREAWDAIRLGLQHDEKPVRVVVEGEEDLLGIPCFLEAPLGAAVLYGMPGKGVVVVTADAAFKRKVAQLLAKFKRE
jgi:GTP-dependent dephospho-CoA kinase